MSPFDNYDLKELLFKICIVLGSLIVIYGVLWLLATLGVIPLIIASIFPQIVIIIIGIFIIYYAINQRNRYY